MYTNIKFTRHVEIDAANGSMYGSSCDTYRVFAPSKNTAELALMRMLVKTGVDYECVQCVGVDPDGAYAVQALSF